jgi:NitT/TauT family transport system ATP-binding protein
MKLSIRNVSVVFRSTGSGTPLPALGPVSCEIESNQFVSLIGPSGCGKSTLIRVIAGLQSATQGAVYLDDQQIEAPSRRIGLMFQDANLMPWRTVIDNIALPLELAGAGREARHDSANVLLEMLGLGDFANAYPGALSGGMAQRVALGRILASQPDVMLLDEPFGALDALTREQVSFDLLNVWRQTKQTLLMVTHDLQEAVLLSDRVLVMSHRPGRIIADITVPLPRPRQFSDIYTPEFIETARLVRQKLSEA